MNEHGTPSAVTAPRLVEHARDLLGSIGVCALIAAAAWTLLPFAKAAVWAGMVVVVTWPLMLRIERRLWHRRGLAVAVMLVLLLVLVVVPLTLFVATIVINGDDVFSRVRSLSQAPPLPLPAWLVRLPIVGDRVATAWQDLVGAGMDGLWTRLAPYAGSATAWLLGRAGTAGYLVVQFVLILLLSAFMYAHGEDLATASRRLAKRLGGEQGTQLVEQATQAIRGVALGVGVTALVQSVLGGAGLAAAGVPFAGLLTALLFVLCIAQIGMLIALIPAVVWVVWNGHAGWGAALLVWSLSVSLIDQLLRPLLVRRTVELPVLLIFLGVVGGLFAFGPLGIFIGPVVLAVAYTLLSTWMRSGGPAAGPASPRTPPS